MTIMVNLAMKDRADDCDVVARTECAAEDEYESRAHRGDTHRRRAADDDDDSSEMIMMVMMMVMMMMVMMNDDDDHDDDDD